MGFQVNATVAFYVSECAACGVSFGMTKQLEQERRKDGGTFYCPNGHRLHFGDSEADKLRRDLQRQVQRNAMLEQEAAEERGRAEKAERAAKLAKRRSAAGTCPCCNRTFGNMARHMKQKHPAFVAENVVALKAGAK